jgi:Protein of unknown function (DUF3808)
MLWKAAEFDNVHGAIAVLAILQYYGNMAQFSDIVPDDHHASGIGYPAKRCRGTLEWIRKRYPHAALWQLEEARMEAVAGRLERTVEMLSKPVNTQMKYYQRIHIIGNGLLTL